MKECTIDPVLRSAMKLVLQTLFALLLVESGILFMRIILGFSGIGGSHVWTTPIYAATNVLTVPISMRMFGIEHPLFVLNGTRGIVEPSVIIALFALLIIAFAISCVLNILSDRKGRL